MNTSSTRSNSKWAVISATVALTTIGALAPSAEAANFTLDFDSGVDGGDVLMNSNGTLVTDQWADWGLTNISGINDRHGNAAKLNLYDTTSWGQDQDLRTNTYWKSGNKIDPGTPEQGNVLIIQEENNSNKNYFNNNDVYRPDDEAAGGFIDFDFAEAVAFKSFSMLDIDDNGGGITVQGTLADGSYLNIDIDALMAEHHNTNGTDASAQGTSVSLNGVTMTQVGRLQGDNSMFRFDVDQAFLTNVKFSYPGSGAISGLEWSTGEEEPRDIPEPSAMGGLLMLGFVGSRKYLKRKQAESSENA